MHFGTFLGLIMVIFLVPFIAVLGTGGLAWVRLDEALEDKYGYGLEGFGRKFGLHLIAVSCALVAAVAMATGLGALYYVGSWSNIFG
jgi:hypothetical protein